MNFFFIIITSTSRPYPSHVWEFCLVHAAATKIVSCRLELLIILACERWLVVVAPVGARGARMPILDVEPTRITCVPVSILLRLIREGGALLLELPLELVGRLLCPW